MLGQTWSLAVEEQFYLVWPALFIITLSYRDHRRRLALWLAILALAVMIYRVIMAHLGYSYDRIYFGTDTHCDGLLIGCAAAFWLASRQSPLNPAGFKMLRTISLLGGVALTILFIFGSNTYAPLEISAAALASVAVIVGLVTEAAPSAIKRILSSRLAVWIGRRSYGLYLWHYSVYVASISLFDHFTNNYEHGGLSADQVPIDLVYVSAFIASFIVAVLSYRFVELPALGLKRRFQSDEHSGGAHRLEGRRRARHETGAARPDVQPSEG